MSVTNTVTWYVARNHLGEFSCGEDGTGDTCWVRSLGIARFHEAIGPVKAAVTKSFKRHPSQPCPEILEWKLDIGSARVVSVAGETEKRVAKAKRVKELRDASDRRQWLVYLGEQEKRIADERRKLESA